MSKKIKHPICVSDKNKEQRIFARQIACELTKEQAKQVSGGKCRKTPEKGDISCDIW